MDTLIQEVSGEIPLNTIRLLASFERRRPAAEYERIIFHESSCILEKLKEYAILGVRCQSVPVIMGSREAWNAESAELWMLEPDE